MIYDVIILGAGAAGLVSAISAGSRGKSVLVLEANDKPGLKILISGGGRCNFTNKSVTPDDFVSENPHFCKSVLSQFTPDDFIEWVKCENISFYEKTLGQLFCEKTSKEILNLLLKKLSEVRGEIITSKKAIKVSHDKNIFSVFSAHHMFQAKNLIVATGGLSYPKLGAHDFGYQLARQFGHSITELSPALDGFVFEDREKKIFLDLAGVSVLATLKIGKKEFTENILFTHAGLSGPAALKASLYWHGRQLLVADFLPSLNDFPKWLDEKRKMDSKKNVATVLMAELPNRFVDCVVRLLKIEDKNMADLSKAEMAELLKILKNYHFLPKSTVGYDKAEVTRGGVDTKDISSKTMASKLVPGLFFVGEVLDVTGLLGGYNFQWAWASGWVSGQHV